MINKKDIAYKPNREELAELIKSDVKELFYEFCTIIEKEYDGKIQIDFSKCSAAYGWNIKYKKSSKAICTIYPENDFFTALITLKFSDLELFDIVKTDFTEYINNLIKKSSPFNGTKWLMINIADRQILDDAIKLLKIKFGKGN
jgi:AraC family transcriptional regulator